MPVAELSRDDTIAHYNAVMIEELRSSQKAVIEHVDIKIDALDRKLENFRSEVNNRFDIVEAAIKYNSMNIKELQAQMREAGGNIKDLQTSMMRVEGRLDDHEDRIATLEGSQV